jgi:hypothetical protein
MPSSTLRRLLGGMTVISAALLCACRPAPAPALTPIHCPIPHP